MLTQRIIGAFTFRKGVYAEVENDPAFTSTAWIIIVVVTFLNRLGSTASSDIGNWLLRAVGGTIFALIGFTLAMFLINRIGRDLFHSDVTFNELVRTIGLASVWGIIGFIGVLAAFSDSLSWLLSPVVTVSVIAMIVAWLVAAKEALDRGWLEMIITVVTAWVVMFVVIVIGSVVLELLGVGADSLGGMLE